MGRKNNSGTLVGPPCGMVNGGKIRTSLEYGWSGCLMNMPIHVGFDLRGSMQIKVTPGNDPRKVEREEIY